MSPEKVLVVGSGGREHALGWRINESSRVDRIFFAPGNAGTGSFGENTGIDSGDIEGLLRFSKDQKITFTVIGPEKPLEAGIVNAFLAEGLGVIGPTREAALLETDKVWATSFMQRHNIPHPKSWVFHDFDEAQRFVESLDHNQIVIKAPGLADGKGVFLPESFDAAKSQLWRIMRDGEFGERRDVLLQERLRGREVTQMALIDGEAIVPLLPAQDYKRRNDGDTGLNTGGMGAFSPAQMDAKLQRQIYEKILVPTINGMKNEGHVYQGVLYAGVMVTNEGPKLLEYNVRFGDPETQPLMMLFSSDLLRALKACADGTLNGDMVSFGDGASICVVLVSDGYPGSYQTGKVIHGLGRVKNADIQIFHAGTRLENGEIVTSGGRVLGVCGRAQTLPLVRDLVYDHIGENEINFEGMGFRSDIGKNSMLPSDR